MTIGWPQSWKFQMTLEFSNPSILLRWNLMKMLLWPSPYTMCFSSWRFLISPSWCIFFCLEFDLFSISSWSLRRRFREKWRNVCNICRKLGQEKRADHCSLLKLLGICSPTYKTPAIIKCTRFKILSKIYGIKNKYGQI